MWTPRARSAIACASSTAIAIPSSASNSGPFSAALPHPLEDRLGDDHPGDLVREVERLLEALRRDEADEDRDARAPPGGRRSGRGPRRRRPAASGRRWLPPRSWRRASRSRRRGPARRGSPRRRWRTTWRCRSAPPARSTPAFSPLTIRRRPSVSTSPTGLRLRVVADLQRVAADDEERLDAEPRRAEEVRLDAEDVPVARGEVEDRVDPGLVSGSCARRRWRTSGGAPSGCR